MEIKIGWEKEKFKKDVTNKMMIFVSVSVSNEYQFSDIIQLSCFQRDRERKREKKISKILKYHEE